MAIPQQAGIRIALAEDNADFRKALATMLAALGHQVVCQAANGCELLQRWSSDFADLVIADLDMPIVDGLEVAETLSHRGVPVILISGHPDILSVNIEHEPLAARLLKPVTTDNLQVAIQQAFARRQEDE